MTTLSDDDTASNPNVRAVLAYACIRLAHLSHDAFGDSRAATRLFRLAKKIDTVPSAVAWSGIGNSIEASMDYLEDEDGSVWREKMEGAVSAYKEAAKLGEGIYNDGENLFHLAVALEVSLSLVANKLFNRLVPWPYSAHKDVDNVMTFVHFSSTSNTTNSALEK